VRGRKRKSKGDFLKIERAKRKKREKDDVENGDELHGEEFGGGFA
jgi:hypothetical protein